MTAQSAPAQARRRHSASMRANEEGNESRRPVVNVGRCSVGPIEREEGGRQGVSARTYDDNSREETGGQRRGGGGSQDQEFGAPRHIVRQGSRTTKNSNIRTDLARAEGPSSPDWTRDPASGPRDEGGRVHPGGRVSGCTEAGWRRRGRQCGSRSGGWTRMQRESE